MRVALAATMLLCVSPFAIAEVKTETVTYEFGGTKLKGHLAYDAAITGKRPGILVVHEWWGLDAYARKRAEMLAALGYVAFAVDMYGDGKTTEHPQEAGQMAGAVRKNIDTWLGRAKAGLKVLQDHDRVDAKKIAAIGYCFGGSTALQLALNGADVAAVVSFHGALPVPTEEQCKAVKSRILICHGSLDSFIPEKTIQEFRGALEKANVDYQFVYYAGAYHSFTVPGADEKMIKGIKYDKNADARSWLHMQQLFKEAFGEK
jgi:dienelactone hydrolase